MLAAIYYAVGVKTANFDLLNSDGLNMQAVMNLDELPDEVRLELADQVEGFTAFKQLILIAHGGKRLWEMLSRSEFKDHEDPVDHFSMHRVERWMAEVSPGSTYKFIYPASPSVVSLQLLGELNGWHHPSPFRIGVNQSWGSWFAYRVVLLSDTDFRPTEAADLLPPCLYCKEKACLSACPPDALTCGEFRLNACTDYRLSERSQCKTQCLARLACPVADQHRYSREQICYHYSCSMRTIEAWQRGR